VKYLNRPGLLSFGTTSALKNFKQDKKVTLYHTHIQTQARLQGQINIDVVAVNCVLKMCDDRQ